MTVLRSPDDVMSPKRVGAARLTRYSFNRTLLRRIASEGWTVTQAQLKLDAQGRGHAVYRVDAGGWEFNFVAFTTTLAEDQHTDRVVAGAWEITGALIDGPIDDDYLAELAVAIPLQEEARLDARVLVLTRGNRSVRFYDYLVEQLASGNQPDANHVADAGYIMRSTAFYGNGKFGMRSFLGYEENHPLRTPYRSQMLAAWLFRELSYDSVERCARLRGGHQAVGFNEQWRTYFGLGNATGLGLVPYFMKHPRVIDTWFGLRETALANVRGRLRDDSAVADLRRWISRAVAHFATLGSGNRAPWCCPVEIAERAERIGSELDRCEHDPYPFEALWAWGNSQDIETTELLVSMLIELDTDTSDDDADAALFVNESVDVVPTMSLTELRSLLCERFGWIDDLGLEQLDASYSWWVISDNTEEPRRVNRSRLDPQHREVTIDVARQTLRLRGALDRALAGEKVGNVGRFLCEHPEHRTAVLRVLGADTPYGELRDNPCDRSFLPLEAQRFQLAMYGMDNFSPKSTDWLRVTLNQGAPRAQLTPTDRASALADDWIWPARPDVTEERT
ncbi:MAG: hypothetical protein ACJAXA_001310 [Candidatus Aldehydirespiratoraceae bacterium]|jgi:hypothetical protein